MQIISLIYYVRQNNGPPKKSMSQFPQPVNVTFHSKKRLCRKDHIKDLEILHYPVVYILVKRVLISERGEQESQDQRRQWGNSFKARMASCEDSVRHCWL